MAEFLAWRDQQKVPSVAAVQPLHVAAWIEQQTQPQHAAPTAKLRLAALTEARENGLAGLTRVRLNQRLRLRRRSAPP